MARSLPGMKREERITRSPGRIWICLWASRAMRARALRGSPWLPVVMTMVWEGGRRSRSPTLISIPGGMARIAQVLGDPGVGHHGLAVEQDLAAELGGDVDDLLHPVDVGGEDRHDHPARGLADQALQGDADLTFGQGVAGAFGVGGVGHQGQDAFFAVVGEPVQVHDGAGHRGLVDLEVAGVRQVALGGVDHKAHPVHDGVADPDEFEFEGPQGEGLRRLNLPEVGGVQQAVLPELLPQQGQGQGGAVDRECRIP